MASIKNGEDEIRFCPACGHEGNDLLCPVCNQKMESLDSEMDRILKNEEKEKKELFNDVSLEDEAAKEVKTTEGKQASESENL